MDKAMQPIRIAKHAFWAECWDKRVIMGFILGMALFGYWMHFFLQFVWESGEPVNILESFIVVEHHNKTMLFLSLGWLLVVADAPFLKGNTYLALYRGSRERNIWHTGCIRPAIVWISAAAGWASPPFPVGQSNAWAFH